MKLVKDIELGFADAENYKRRENKELLNRVFIRDAHLDSLCEPHVSFLIGEKGTGKTAYSIFLTNNSYKNTTSNTRYVRETEYQKFISLKRETHLSLSIEQAEDHKPFIHWCFKDRSYANISPKVKVDVEYQIFYGLAKALNVGKKFK